MALLYVHLQNSFQMQPEWLANLNKACKELVPAEFPLTKVLKGSATIFVVVGMLLGTILRSVFFESQENLCQLEVQNNTGCCRWALP